MSSPFDPMRPGRFDLGRLNIADGAALPRIADCRICGDDLRVHGAYLICPRCDRNNPPRKD